MDALRKLTLLVGATLLALSLVAGPAMAADEPAGTDAGTETTETGADTDDGDQRIAVAETPRDRLGLILLGALVVGGGLALANARRQLKGERPTASGEFRWR